MFTPLPLCPSPGKDPNNNPNVEVSWDYVDCAPFINGTIKVSAAGSDGCCAFFAHVHAHTTRTHRCRPEPPPLLFPPFTDADQAGRQVSMNEMSKAQWTGLKDGKRCAAHAVHTA